MLSSYSAILRRRLLLVVALTLTLAGLSYLALTERPAAYRSEALIEVTSGSVAEQVIGQSRGYEEPERRVATEIEVLESRPVARGAADRLGSRGISVTVDQAAAAVTATERGTSNYVEVSGVASDPLLARDLTEAFVRAYFDYRRGVQRDELAVLERELQEQLAAAVAELAALGPARSDEPADRSRTRAGALERVSTSTTLLEQVRLRTAVETSAVRLLSEASTPTRPVGQLPRFVLAVIAAVGAFLMALSVVFGLEVLRDPVRTREEAERLTGAAALAELPRDQSSISGLPQRFPPQHPASAAARTLRLRLGAGSSGHSPSRILVTSLRGEATDAWGAGVQLASSYAEIGLRVLLVADTGWAVVAEEPGDPLRDVGQERPGTVQVGRVIATRVPEMPGVWCAQATTNDERVGILDTARPGDLLDSMSKRFDITVLVISEGTGVEPVAVVHLVSSVLVLVTLGRTAGRRLRRLVGSVDQGGSPVRGIILRTAPRHRQWPRFLRRRHRRRTAAPTNVSVERPPELAAQSAPPADVLPRRPESSWAAPPLEVTPPSAADVHPPVRSDSSWAASPLEATPPPSGSSDPPVQEGAQPTWLRQT